MENATELRRNRRNRDGFPTDWRSDIPSGFRRNSVVIPSIPWIFHGFSMESTESQRNQGFHFSMFPVCYENCIFICRRLCIIIFPILSNTPSYHSQIAYAIMTTVQHFSASAVTQHYSNRDTQSYSNPILYYGFQLTLTQYYSFQFTLTQYYSF